MDAQLNLRKLMETELAPVPVKAAPVPSPVVKPALSQATAPAQANAAATAPDATLAAQRQQQAARDAVAHAQSLWNAGSHESAIELMQEVLASSERTLANASNASNLQALSLAVRELARMQLAESRPAPVLELLIRLEPVLGNQADLWALRANAAQRLGRHQDSVHAYMVALQSRPNEQRWLLGTAVSLAALGQTASAADMAEKARAVGVVSKEVLAYLRQMGVPVKD
jgi:tetratricopeptide (TPR) repeat protein